MKKISFLMLHMGYGGVESAIVNQANMLCNDFEVEIVSLYKLSNECPHQLNNKIKVSYLTNLEPNKREFIQAVNDKKIIKIFKEGLKAVKILYLKRKLMKEYIKKSDANIIISTRYSFNKILGMNAKSDVIKISQEHSHHNNNKRYINKIINSIKKIDYFMPVSKELTEFYKEKINNKPKCVYIKHALDFKIEKYNYKLTKNLIAVARLSKEKGFSDLLDVIKLIKEEIPDIKLNLIGDGIERENLINKIKELKLEDNVLMHGFKNRNEINKIIKDCSLYCMTSFEESFGLSVIEAMAFGLPCVAFDDAKGVMEIIDKNSGIKITNRDKRKMAKKIIYLLNNEDKLKKLSKNSYLKSMSYSYDVIQKEWIEFYNKII